jgi:hypothetical protein
LMQKDVYFCVPHDIISLLDGNTIQSLFKRCCALVVSSLMEERSWKLYR